MSLEVPEQVRPIRASVKQFIEEKIYPVEQILEELDPRAQMLLGARVVRPLHLDEAEEQVSQKAG